MPDVSAAGNVDLDQLLLDIADRRRGRAEATLQGLIQTLLTTSGLNLANNDVIPVDLEAQVGGGQRIDIEMGSCIIEVKRDLSAPNALAAAQAQLAGYVRERTRSFERRYVGILTDGADWRLYHLIGDDFEQVSRFEVAPGCPAADLIEWIGGALSTDEKIVPTAANIAQRLGATSTGYAIDLADLAALHERAMSTDGDGPDTAVTLKQQLWGKLLTTALGTQFDVDNSRLFIEHTYLVIVAECVAHAVLGFDLRKIAPAALVRGDRFSADARILGVVEQDFFDWPIDCGDDGRRWIAAVATRVAQFDWSAVEHDVMKVIYQSVIPAEVRKHLGEYYTPDFLAEAMVANTITDPLSQRVLDPSCGSGTFLFHAVRHYLRAADDAGTDTDTALAGVVEHVMGMDLHPVAVSLARVTYLLALGTNRLLERTTPLRVPVYLGDSLQWGQRKDLFSSETLNVATDDGAQVFADELRFPARLLRDAERFDRLVGDMADLATNRERNSPPPSIRQIERRHGISGDDLAVLEQTLGQMARLHDENRNHIWGYYVRNLARPAWLAMEPNRVDVLIGNPPWLSYRYMTAPMQATFKAMSGDRQLWTGGSVATQQDLSDLFIVRCVEQYLRGDGRFSFVMPAAVLSRQQYAGFRAGRWPTPEGQVGVDFGPSWDLSMLYPYFFPRTSAVIHGERGGGSPMPSEVEKWTGSIPDATAPWNVVAPFVSRAEGVTADGEGGAESAYKTRFANGATIFPRVLTTVEDGDESPIGLAGRRAVRSNRGVYEKQPWKAMDALTAVVENEFVIPTIFGECVLPYRQATAMSAVLPVTADGRMLEGEDLSDYPGLADWWQKAETLWNANRSSKLTLSDNVNYRRKLTEQFPLAPERVVYGASGMHVTACRVTDPRAVVEHQLYWAAAWSTEEALYLCSILNSVTLTRLVEPHMVSGKGGGRHIDKYLWRVPIPLFDPADGPHAQLAELGRDAERLAGEIELPSMAHGRVRRMMREALAESEVGQRIEAAVAELLRSSNG